MKVAYEGQIQVEDGVYSLVLTITHGNSETWTSPPVPLRATTDAEATALADRLIRTLASLLGDEIDLVDAL